MSLALAENRIREMGVDHYDRERDLPRLLKLTLPEAVALDTPAIIERLGKAALAESRLRDIGHKDYSFMRLASLQAALEAELMRHATEHEIVYHHLIEQMENTGL